MAASAAVFWFTSNLFCLILLFTAVTTNENTSSYNLNMNILFGDQNVTYNATDNYTTTQTTELDPTTQTPSHSDTQEPVQTILPTDPLPASGRLLTPVTNGKMSFYRTTLLNTFSILSIKLYQIASQLRSILGSTKLMW